MAALMFSACSRDEDTTGSNGPDGEATTSYLTVNLVAAPNMGTRATGDKENYEDGTANENKVTSVRFYFFDASSKAAPVKQNAQQGYDNYYDWSVDDDESTGSDAPNVEKKLKATLIIKSPKSAEDKMPASVVAVINPPVGLPTDVASLEDLNKITADYSALSNNNFVMSNSVYADGTTKMEAVNVSGHICPTEAAALKDPVVIYVERVLAKVRLDVADLTGQIKDVNYGGETFTIYPTSTNDKEQKFENKDIYVRFLGWNVTATADKSHLMKSIDPTWPDNLFGASEPWNFDAYFRSFWAINPTGGVNYGYGPFNTADDNTRANLKNFADANYTYVQENAAETTGAASKTKTPTQVIIAAQLVDNAGKPMEFAEWAGEKYSVDDLMVELADHASLYKEDQVPDPENPGKTKLGRRKVLPTEIELKTATEVNGEPQKTQPGRYYVYAQLKQSEFGGNNKWFKDTEMGNGTTILPSPQITNIDEANEQLEAAGHAKVWKSGMTYYYFDIEHLGEEGKPGEYGVVRNHLYNANITKIAGLGTPVYNPDEDIYPEKPEDDDQYIAAEINILSWRLVPNDVVLEW